MAGRKIRSAEDARGCLKAQTAAGTSLVAWAHDHGVDARSLNAWRLNLRRGGGGAAVQLVELVPTASLPAARYVVRCGPFAVEVDEGFEERTLARLLRVVLEC